MSLDGIDGNGGIFEPAMNLPIDITVRTRRDQAAINKRSTVILDLFARRVVGWAVSENLGATVAVTALQRALALRPAPGGLVHHSDRGVHYACADYRAVLEKHGVRRSMSRKGNCWDNAVAESFFSSLKFELEDHAQWHDAREVERDLAAHIDGFYNAERRHSHNRYQSPIDFEREFAQQGIRS